MEVDEVAGEKKRRLRVPPTVMETLRAILANVITLEQYSYYMLIALERELLFYHNKVTMVAESGIQRRKSVPDEFKPSFMVRVNLRSRFTIDSIPERRVDAGNYCLPAI